jgi:hypothetical protein
VNPTDPAQEIAQSIAPVDFGGKVSLIGYELNGDDLTLLWEATGTMEEDFTVFAYVLDDSTVIAQGDAPPILPTRFWGIGERYTTHHHLSYPATPEPGTYTLYVGWYSTTQPMRLAAVYPDNAFPLTTIIVPASP